MDGNTQLVGTCENSLKISLKVNIFPSGNRWYDQALSEMILETLDFNAKADWWCVEGGSSEITNRMRARIELLHKKNKILFNKRVTEMRLLDINTSKESVAVGIQGEHGQTRQYDAVFNSAPLGSMQRMKRAY